jgi:hypothetical protein
LVDRHTLREDQAHTLGTLAHPQRTILTCSREHRNYGHGCRHDFLLEGHWQEDYILHLDDDDFLADPGVLQTLANTVTAEWAIFPVHRSGSWFYDPKPGFCRTTISSYVLRSDCAREAGFPDAGDGADSQYVEDVLVARWPHPQMLGDQRHLVVIPHFNHGVEEVRP